MSLTILVYTPSHLHDYLVHLAPRLTQHRLRSASTPAEAAELISEADVLFTWGFPVHLLPRAARLKWVQKMGAGVEDLIGSLPAGCQLTRLVDVFGSYMSEYAVAHMLAHSQNLRRVYADQAERRWSSHHPAKLQGRRLGVAGAGSIGIEVARKGRAFGMEVWALVRTPRPLPEADRLFVPQEAAAFCAGVDYLVSSLPHTPETVGLIDPLAMKPGSLLINMGRGATIDEAAILEAVRGGRIQAVLDVFHKEPLPAEHPFWGTPGITVTPHISGPTVTEEACMIFLENLDRFLAGQPLQGQVNRGRGY